MVLPRFPCPMNSRSKASANRRKLRSESDRRFRRFADAFEQEFIGQGKRGRTIEETLEEGWKLLRRLPKDQLTRIRADHVGKHYGAAADAAGRTGE